MGAVHLLPRGLFSTHSTAAPDYPTHWDALGQAILSWPLGLPTKGRQIVNTQTHIVSAVGHCAEALMLARIKCNSVSNPIWHGGDSGLSRQNDSLKSLTQGSDIRIASLSWSPPSFYLSLFPPNPSLQRSAGSLQEAQGQCCWRPLGRPEDPSRGEEGRKSTSSHMPLHLTHASVSPSVTWE